MIAKGYKRILFYLMVSSCQSLEKLEEITQ